MAQDAIALLKADHREVEDLFEKYESTNGAAAKRKLAEQICLELTIHTQIEEEIFYPACKGKVEDDLLEESFVEHDGAKVLIAEISGGKPSDSFYDAKVTVLAEQIKHHVHEEEAFLKGLFAQARRSDLDRVRDGIASRFYGGLTDNIFEAVPGDGALAITEP